MDYSAIATALTNQNIIKTILSEDPSNLYDGATSYQSKYSNLVDNYGLSKKLGTSYKTYYDLINGKNKAHSTVAKLVDIDLSNANAGNDIDDTYSQDQVVREFTDMVDAAKAKELVKLYFAQYIGKLSSDLQWRLGNSIDTTTDIDENMLVDGKYPSRGFVIPTKNEVIYNGKNL